MERPARDERSAVEAAQTGDPRAFADLLQASDGRMRALAYRLVRNRTTMDDVLQAAYLKAYRGLGSFRAESGFESWLYAIVYRTCLDHLRSPASRTVVPLDERAIGDDDADVALAAAERLDISKALDRLPIPQRAAVWLVDGEGHTFAQAAAILDERPGTVASRVSRGRATLRTLLADPDRQPATSPGVDPDSTEVAG